MTSESGNGECWSIDDIALECIELDRVQPQEGLFLLLAGASFVETGADLYTRNLLEKFRGDAEVSRWLSEHWEREELQHGRALRAYVNRTWPQFDWQDAFDAFMGEYSRSCTTEELESSSCLELAGRCVVEMGTATYYRAIQAVSDEPVLKALLAHIQRDEVRHYKHFYRYFVRYNNAEHYSRATVFGALARRLWLTIRSDAECGLWYPYSALHPHAARQGPEFRLAVTRAKALLRANYPSPMAFKMLIKPLALPSVLKRLSYAPASLMQRLILH
jgi:hypothetical protein